MLKLCFLRCRWLGINVNTDFVDVEDAQEFIEEILEFSSGGGAVMLVRSEDDIPKGIEYKMI